jgi:tRNA pseudouridine13 synthase
MRAHGLPNYFDDQRFGNLTHGQGWIFKDLAAGRFESALRTLLAARSPRDDERHRRFKQGLEQHWGDWRECRDVAGRFGAHHSVFEHLAKAPGDFAGAFDHVASRVKLIHLYAWQSHLWNRAVVAFVREPLPLEERVVFECTEGPLVSHRLAPPPALAAKPTFRLPGERLEDVPADERPFLEEALAAEGLVADQMRIESVRGFQLKGEDRALILRPAHLRVRPPELDNLNPGSSLVRIRFELSRGSYATLVVKRLFARSVGEKPPEVVLRPERTLRGTRERSTGRSERRGQQRWPGRRHDRRRGEDGR